MAYEYTPMRKPCCIPGRMMDVQRKLKKEQEILKCAPTELCSPVLFDFIVHDFYCTQIVIICIMYDWYKLV